MTGTLAQSDNARHIVFRKDDALYFVNEVSVALKDGENVFRAVFHAKESGSTKHLDLVEEIPITFYDVLVAYAKEGNPDQMLILLKINSDLKWFLVSESLVRQYWGKPTILPYVV